MTPCDLSIVTGYVRLDSPHRHHDEYMRYLEQLLDVGLPLTVFTQQLKDCWLHQHYASLAWQIEPGGKDSLAYYCVQHEKTAWLCRAAQAWTPKTLVWIDAAILHIKRIQPKHVLGYVERVRALPPTRITAPSCHPVPPSWDDRIVCWAFCGGVVAVPAAEAAWFHAETVREATAAPLTWEVNTWAKIAKRNPHRFSLYAADHNERMFTGYMT